MGICFILARIEIVYCDSHLFTTEAHVHHRGTENTKELTVKKEEIDCKESFLK